MDSLVSFSKWLSKWFTVAVILWAAFNYALPATSSWVIPNTAYLAWFDSLWYGAYLDH